MNRLVQEKSLYQILPHMPPGVVRTRTMDAFNNGCPLRVVMGNDGRMGVVDDARFRV